MTIRFLFYSILIAQCCGLMPECRAQCTGLKADAGPDLVRCDSSQTLQLQGSIQGNYTKFYWTPTTGLSNPNILDPIITLKTTGRYTYKLTAEGISTVNLVKNGDFESGNSSFSSSYNYTPTNTTEGEYFVTPNPSSWNGGFTNCSDHTTGSGNMLLLNGHPVAGTNFWCQTIATVIGRTYQFEFWSCSVVAFNIGQLNIKVNGNSVGATAAGGLCNWTYYSVSFIATSSSTQICLSESTGIRGGNDFAVDDIALYEKCMDMDQVTVEIVNLVARIEIPNPPKCSSDPFDLNAIGSSAGPNIRYEWSTDIGKIISKNGLTAKGKGSGIYTVKVIYTNGTVMCEQEASIEFNAPDVLAGIVDGLGKVNCRMDSIKLKAIVQTGSGLYTYKWSPDSSILRGQNTEEIIVNQSKKYSVTVTDQSSGCTLMIDYEVPADTLKPLVQINGDTLITCKHPGVQLFSQLRDSLNYIIKWSRPNLLTTFGKASISDSLSGMYRLVIVDAKNFCSDSVEWLVKLDTSKPLIELGSDLSIDCIQTAVSVGNLQSNGLKKISYQWSFNTKNDPPEDSLIPKTYFSSGLVILKLTDTTNGCTVLDSLFIKDLRKIPYLDVDSAGILTCKTNQVTLNAQIDSKDSLDLFWSTTNGQIISGQNSLSPEVNKKAWYYIHIINRLNSCENVDSVFVDENFNRPIANAGPDLLFSCKDTTKFIDGSMSSQGPNIIYQWVTPNGTIKNGNGTSRIEVRSSGIYKIIVTDTINGCRDSAVMSVNPDLNKPLVQWANPDTLNCIKKSIVLSVSAISQTGNPLQYEWSTTNGSLLGRTDTIMVMVDKAGSYQFVATDKINGCSTIAQMQVIIDTIKPVISAGKDQFWNCETTQIQLSGTSSNAGNVHQWFTVDGLLQGNSNALNSIALKPGVYFLQSTNLINGCLSIDSILVIPDLVKPNLFINSPDILSCKLDSILLMAQSTTPVSRIQYVWTTTNGNLIGKPNNFNAWIHQPAWYQFTIVDTVNKCITTDSVFVTEDTSKPTIQLIKPLQLTCTRKSIQLEGIVGNVNSNYSLDWTTKNGHISGSSKDLQVEVDQEGIYYFLVQNLVNGCETLDSVEVLENKNIPKDFQYQLQQIKCPGDLGSIVILGVTGGEPVLNYFLDNKPIAGNTVNGLSPGIYSLKIVDANGCELIKQIQLNQAHVVGISLPPSVKINLGERHQLQAVIDSPPDSIAWISWSPSEHLSCSDCPNPIVSGLENETSYTVSYATKNGCTASATIRIQVIRRGIWLPNAFSPNGDHINDWFYPIVADDSYHEINYLSIYNRWGEQVFHKEHFQPNDPTQGWDGTFNNQKLNPAVFVFVVEVEWNNGETRKLWGDISLIR